MTDNRATELREKLDALGIEHFDYDKGGRTQTMWEATDGKRHFTYETQDNPAKTAKLVISWFPTPEQAIAAMMGSERERELELLVKQLWYLVNHRSGYGYAAALESIEELGIEVEQ